MLIDWMPQVTKKLAYLTPSTELVDAYLTEIARGYGLHYTPIGGSSEKKDDAADDVDDNDGGGGLKVVLRLS